VPAVLAVAAEKHLTGHTVLEAVLHGFEAMCRVGNAVGPTHYQVWHNTATCGPFGSAMAAATLEQLDDGQAMHALGNAGTQSSGFWEFLDTGAMSKHLHAGRAAEAGVVAAQLAQLGFTGPPAVLEGKKGFFAAACPDARPEAVLANPERPWQLMLTSIKPWPCCRHAHPAVDAALEIHQKLQGAEIEAITVDTYQAALDVCDRPRPDSEYEAKFSLHHTVAAALSTGRIGFDSFGPQARDDLADLRSRLSVRAAEPYRSAYPETWGAKVRVDTVDGRSLMAERSGAKGDPEFALNDAEMTAKANRLLTFGGCDREEATQIVAAVLGLTESADASECIDFINQRLR
jgi:2-methylcitrate dehydratase PrpD